MAEAVSTMEFRTAVLFQNSRIEIVLRGGDYDALRAFASQIDKAIVSIARQPMLVAPTSQEESHD